MKGLLAVLAMASIAGLASAQPLESLSELRWSHRVILIGDDDPRTLGQLAERRAGLEERHVIWIAVGKETAQSNAESGLASALLDELQRDYFDRFNDKVFLIGKDGTLKSTQTELDLQELFGRIDAMPMRQREMRQQSNP
jgi:hypothetical protein